MTTHSPSSNDIPRLVSEVLDEALRRHASDIHIEPTAGGCEIRFRVDGVLARISTTTSEIGRAMVGRLMVMAQLLTYRLDIPQEGRLQLISNGLPLDLRLAIMPTTHGLRAAVRMPAELIQPGTLDELGLPARILEGIKQFAAGDSGMLAIFAGPAGSGKTTTIYALLRHIIQHQSGLSVIALEDPVERDIPGVTQIEVKPFGELTYERALRSILRQDPQVLMLGEIRDGATAALAVQATLSGHRLVCTFHAADPAGAIARLLEMGIEPYQVTSSLFGVVAQRLLRRKTEPGYLGRVPIAEFVSADDPLRAAILRRGDAALFRAAYQSQAGFETMRRVADALVAGGVTDAAEVTRVLGD